MMEPMTESEALNTSAPTPPPIPSSPPPGEGGITGTPPEKPKKLRRGISPTKESSLRTKGSNISTAEQQQNGDNDRNEAIRPASPEAANNSKTNGSIEVTLTEPLEEKVNGFHNSIIDTKQQEDEDSPSTESKINGVDDSATVSQGVAKIVDEIEKFNSLGRNKTNGSAEHKFDDIKLRDKSPSNKPLTPIERSVLREMPVDVEMDPIYSRNNSPRKSENGGDLDSSRRNASVKRTPTMEFKKQCSKIVRIRTKILQNLGKADKTTDEVFDEYEVNFTRQQSNANRLHKEVSNYLRCARALHGASKALFETLSEVYETEWTGSDLIYTQAQSSDMLWTDFVHKLQDQTLAPLSAYQIQFPELRKKIDKRGRKLVDYDSHRHQLEALQRSNRRDEYKMARCKDQLEQARTTYDGLNKDLYEELPTIYDQRILNTTESLQTLYAAESVFMRESSKIAQELEAITDKLASEGRQGKYRTNRGTPVTPRPVSMSVPSVNAQATSPKEEIGRPYEEIQFEEGSKVNGTGAIGTKTPLDNKAKTDELYDIPVGATTSGLPSGVLYQVRTTYKYEREDVDELGFDVGETINVVEYDDPEEQEEGWLCGYKVTTNEKGLFPANFTRPI